jgi:hypothetical protein
VRLRHHQPTRDYVERRTAQGLSKREIIRRLKRYIARESSPRYHRPTTNRPHSAPLDKHRSIERFNHTLLDEWTYAASGDQKAAEHEHLHHGSIATTITRHHTAIGGPPDSRITISQGRTTRRIDRLQTAESDVLPRL